MVLDSSHNKFDTIQDKKKTMVLESPVWSHPLFAAFLTDTNF